MKGFLLILGVILFINLNAQQFSSLENIFHYTKEEYKAGNQNWGIAQDQIGRIYFANNEGLLSFDGKNWELHPISNHTIIRSLYISKDEKIYVGGQEDFGFFQPNQHGELRFHSLKDKIPNNLASDFADIWNIEAIGNTIFFRSNRKIFTYDGKTIQTFPSKNWSFLGKMGDKMFAFDDDKGLLVFNGDHWDIFIQKGQFPEHIQTTGMISLGANKILISTLNNGFFIHSDNITTPYIQGKFQQISHLNIYKIIPIDTQEIAVITNFGGCLVLDHQGNIQREYTRKQGIQTNNILNGFIDKTKNLWLGLDNGIDLIEINNPNRNIYPDLQNLQTGNCSIIYKGILYLGTPTGLYEYNPIDKKYTIVPNTESSILGLNIIHDKLLIGTLKNAFSFDGANLTRLNNSPTGFWNFHAIPNTDYIVSGTFNGLHFFKIEGDNIVPTTIESVFESAKYVGIVGNQIFALHPYKGLYIIDLSEKYIPQKITHIANSTYLSSNHNHLFQWNNTVILSSDKGSFEWNIAAKKFQPWTQFNQVFKQKNLSFLVQNSNKSIWFISNGRLGTIQNPTNAAITWHDELSGRLQNEENQNIHLINPNEAIITGDKGFYLANLINRKENISPFHLYFNKISIQKNEQYDSILNGGFNSKFDNEIPIKYAFNTINLSYQAIQYNKYYKIQYSYILEGFDRNWSQWSEKTEKSYTQLPNGNYTFIVKAKNTFTSEIQSIKYSFSILPPWYKTWWFYTLCVLFIIVGIILFSIYQHRRYIRIQQRKLSIQEQEHAIKKKELKLQHQLELEIKNKAIVELQNSKLTNEITIKNATIASNAMAMAKKSEAFLLLKEELLTYPEMEKNNSFKKLLKKIESQIDNQTEWENFLSHFDSVNDNFLIKLKEKIPSLTSSEKKLCALLKLELTSKEIAEILNISLKGVEIARYRLRKKLQLNQDTNLHQYFSQIL